MSGARQLGVESGEWGEARRGGSSSELARAERRREAAASLGVGAIEQPTTVPHSMHTHYARTHARTHAPVELGPGSAGSESLDVEQGGERRWGWRL